MEKYFEYLEYLKENGCDTRLLEEMIKEGVRL